MYFQEGSLRPFFAQILKHNSSNHKHIGQFGEAGLHKWMPFVIFHEEVMRGRSVTSRPISEYTLLHAVYNNGSWT